MTSGHRGTKLNEQEVSSSEEAMRMEMFSSGAGAQRRKWFFFSQGHWEIIFYQVERRQAPLSATFGFSVNIKTISLLIAEDGILQREAWSLGMLPAIDRLINQSSKGMVPL